MEQGIWAIMGIYVTVMAVIDIRKREIPVVPGIACTVAIIALQLLRGIGWWTWLPGVAISGILWFVCKISHGAVGMGDAMVYLVLGVGLGFFENMEVLTISLFLAAVAGVIMMIWRRVGRNYAMPFIPFTAAAYAAVICL